MPTPPKPTHTTQKRKTQSGGRAVESEPKVARADGPASDKVAAKGRTTRRTKDDVEEAREASGGADRGRTKRRSSAEVESAREMRRETSRTVKAVRGTTSRRSSGGMDSARKKPSMLVPALGVVVVVAGVAGYLVFGRPNGGGVAKDPAGNGSTARPTPPKSVGGSDADPEVRPTAPAGSPRELEETLRQTEEEMEMYPPGALAQAERVLKVAKEGGHEAIAARAAELVTKINAILPEYWAKEFDTRTESIGKLLEEDMLFDAIGVFEEVERIFDKNDSEVIKGKLTALRATIGAARTKAIDAIKATILQHFEKAEWNEARERIADIEWYGGEGEKIAEDFRGRFDEFRQKYFQRELVAIRGKRRAEGQAVYDKALAELKAHHAREADLFARRSAKGREATASRPIATVKLRDKSLFINATIDKVDEVNVTLSGKVKGQDVKGRAVDWNLLEPDSRVALTPLTLTDDDAEGHVEFGKFCIVSRRFDEAKKAFEKAVAIDAKLSGTLPDIEEFRKEPTYSSGIEKWAGDRLSIEFPFDNAGEIDDFGQNDDDIKIEGGQLKTKAMNQISLGSAYDFLPSLHYEVATGSAPPAGYWCYYLRYRLGKETKAIALFLNDQGKEYAISEGGMLGSGLPFFFLAQILLQQPDQLTFKGVKGGNVRVLADKDKVSILVGEDSVYTDAGEVSSAKLWMMGYSRNRQTTFGIESLRFEGKMPKEKHKRSIDEKRSWLQKKLHARVVRSESGESPEDRLPKLPDEIKELVPADAQFEYLDALRALRGLRGTADELVDLKKRFENLVKKANKCAAVYFYRGFFHQMIGEYGEAVVEYDKAIALDPDFAEAHAYKASQLALMDRREDAVAAVQKALAGSPSMALARQLDGKVLFYGRKDDAEGREAIEKMELARLLAPDDAELAAELEQLKAVLRGPPWPNGRPTPISNDHFILHSDLPADEAKQMLVELDQIYAEFEGMFPTPAGFKRPKGTVFSFATHATFMIYYEQSLGHASDNTLGYFHPGLKDIHLFKLKEEGEGDETDTLDVLRHEAWHQYIAPTIPTIPRWINEGMAEYFGAISFDKQGKPTKNLHKGRLTNLKQYKDAGMIMKLADLMSSTTGEFMRYGPGYGHAWLFSYLCLIHKPEKYADVLKAYLTRLQKGESRELAHTETFGKIDIDAMERDWNVMVDELLAKLPKE